MSSLPERARRVLRNIRQAVPSGVVLGRRSQGDGPVEFISIADEFTQAALDAISATQGSILYRNASEWVALAPGTSGHFLKTNGAAANPEWAAASGGGGGGISFSCYTSGFETSVSTNANATAGNLFTPTVDVSITAILALIDGQSSATMVGRVYEVNNSTTVGTIVTEVATSASIGSVTTEPYHYRFILSSPVSLTAGTSYLVCVSRTDGTGTSALGMGWGRGKGMEGPFTLEDTEGQNYNSIQPVATNTPASQQAATRTYAIGLEGSSV